MQKHKINLILWGVLKGEIKNGNHLLYFIRINEDRCRRLFFWEKIWVRELISFRRKTADSLGGSWRRPIFAWYWHCASRSKALKYFVEFKFVSKIGRLRYCAPFRRETINAKHDNCVYPNLCCTGSCMWGDHEFFMWYLEFWPNNLWSYYRITSVEINQE